jgi:hypothetical protein
MCRGHVGHLYSPPMETYVEFVQPPPTAPPESPQQRPEDALQRPFLRREMCIIIFGMIIIIAIFVAGYRLMQK